ncbi:FG-GAP repeat domain-containing protein, partial [Candidatus Neomarinimicrobiota bacterium]
MSSKNRFHMAKLTPVLCMPALLSALLLSLLGTSLAVGQTPFTNIAPSAGILPFQYSDYLSVSEGYIVGGIAVGDFNGDGYDDLYITNGRGAPNRLYINNQDETFDEIGSIAGVADMSESAGAVAGDIDNDGDLDIYLCNFNYPHGYNDFGNKLYLNDGSGHFRDATLEAGVGLIAQSASAALVDYDNNGYLDIYIANRYHYPGDYPTNTLYHNNGDGTFTDRTSAVGLTNEKKGDLTAGFFDYDNDNDLDCYVVEEFQLDQFYQNNGNGTFTNITSLLDLPSGGGMGIDFSDYDFDGDIDFYITNFMSDFFFINNGDGSFAEGILETDLWENENIGWGINFFDSDNDGDED